MALANEIAANDPFTLRMLKWAANSAQDAIRVSKTVNLKTSILLTGFAHDTPERPRFYLSFWEELITRVQQIESTGCAALQLAFVACGRMDGFWEFGLSQWDVAAGALIVEEAGGIVTNVDGTRFDSTGLVRWWLPTGAYIRSWLM